MTDYQAGYVAYHLANALKDCKPAITYVPPGGYSDGYSLVAFATVPASMSDEEWRKRFGHLDLLSVDEHGNRKVIMIYTWYTAELKEMIETYWQEPATEQEQ